jgi:putative transcriptional regulator
MYKPIEVDREKLTIMGVPFPDRKSLERAASAIGSNMFEGWEPTSVQIELYRDYAAGKFTLAQVLQRFREVGKEP